MFKETKLEEKSGVNPGCSVDWSWLAGRKIASAVNDLQTIVITFEDGQTFRVQALTYKSEAFLSFTPYKDPTHEK